MKLAQDINRMYHSDIPSVRSLENQQVAVSAQTFHRAPTPEHGIGYLTRTQYIRQVSSPVAY